MSNALLAAALTAITKNNVITYDDFIAKKFGDEDYIYGALDQNALHQCHLVGGKVPHQGHQGRKDLTCITQCKHMPIFIMDITGQKLLLDCLPTETIKSVKLKIQEKKELTEYWGHLIYRGKMLNNDRSLLDYDIQRESILCMTMKSSGGGGPQALYLRNDHLDPRFDYDFTNLLDNGDTFTRGKFEYKRPYGWKRIALNVLDKYNDNIWLGAVRNRTASTTAMDDEWPVSYHGTARNNCRSIAEDGLLLCKGKPFLFGRGIYSTPDINVAALYAEKFSYEGNTYQVVFQNRVNPNGLEIIGKYITNVGEYWISREQSDLRPYGICIRKYEAPELTGAIHGTTKEVTGNNTRDSSNSSCSII